MMIVACCDKMRGGSVYAGVKSNFERKWTQVVEAGPGELTAWSSPTGPPARASAWRPGTHLTAKAKKIQNHCRSCDLPAYRA